MKPKFDIEILLDKEVLESDLDLQRASLAVSRIMNSSNKDELSREVEQKLFDLIIAYNKVSVKKDDEIADDLLENEELFFNGKKLLPSSLEERARRVEGKLLKQQPVTLEKAKAQVAWLKAKGAIRRKRK